MTSYSRHWILLIMMVTSLWACSSSSKNVPLAVNPLIAPPDVPKVATEDFLMMPANLLSPEQINQYVKEDHVSLLPPGSQLEAKEQGKQKK